ncbi:MAG: shikimate dehydrogenase [Balneolaceae bacterium]
MQAEKPHYLVVGHPVGHSLSPQMHTLALRHYQIEAEYYAVDLESRDLSSFVSWINRESFLGANITIPWKKEFLEVADRLDESAIAAGALNTLVKSNGVLTGFNTDIDGFIYPLLSLEDRLKGGTATVFGTGGAAMAVICALERLGLETIFVISRNPELSKIKKRNNLVLCDYSQLEHCGEESSLIINTTPLGMGAHAGRSPVKDSETGILEGKICYDLIYNPLQTKFLTQAKEAGGTVINGLEMFIRQGEASFRLWTGHSFPAEKVKERLLTILNGM